ncbi:MAG: 7-cyano-7-deazaguanine synthase QueC [Thermoanaerobaculia bacterium]
MKALILLSGGIDSAVCALIAKRKKREIYGLTFLYNQKHKIEIEKAKKLGKSLSLKKHFFLKIPAEIFETSSLVNKKLKVPKGLKKDKIPSTYVPSRNLIFLSIASALAESGGFDEIYIGANSIDFSGYPDCTPKFIRAFQNTLNKGTKRGVEGRAIKILAPLLKMSKAEIIKLGKKLGLDFSLTWSCYSPVKNRYPCGKCPSCIIRKKGFEEAKINDPL